MYEYVCGSLVAIFPNAAVVDVSGIGLRIQINKSCPSRALKTGERVKFWIEFVVREDSHTLYGFSNKEDRDFFRLLQQVGGIGPKLALNVLGQSSSGEIADGILQKNIKALSSLPGVGKKLAERIIIELYERVGALVQSGSIQLSTNTELLRQAIQALQTLGLSASDARSAVLTAQQTKPELGSVEKLVQYTLTQRKR